MSQPSKPDGTDPRIVIPAEDEPMVIVKASFGGTGNAYHTCECRNVDKMRATREVKQSVAEWKGYHECEVCITQGEFNDDPDRDEQASTGNKVHAEPTREECAEFRRAILEGKSPGKVAAASDWGRTAVYTHATGDCRHDTPHPPLEHGWYADAEQDDSGVPGSNNTRIASKTCIAIRRRLLEGESREEVSEAVDLSSGCVVDHAYGRCEHVHTTCNALSRGWHTVEGDQ